MEAAGGSDHINVITRHIFDRLQKSSWDTMSAQLFSQHISQGIPINPYHEASCYRWGGESGFHLTK